MAEYTTQKDEAVAHEEKIRLEGIKWHFVNLLQKKKRTEKNLKEVDAEIAKLEEDGEIKRCDEPAFAIGSSSTMTISGG